MNLYILISKVILHFLIALIYIIFKSYREIIIINTFKIINFLKKLKKLKNELSQLLPSINETIETNFNEYITLLNDTAEQLQITIINEGYQNKSIICMEWQSDFIKWLGLNVISYYAPPESLSTQDMLNISNAAQKNEICVIIDNLQSGTDFGARIASESGASHVIFTNFPGAIPGARGTTLAAALPRPVAARESDPPRGSLPRPGGHWSRTLCRDAPLDAEIGLVARPGADGGPGPGNGQPFVGRLSLHTSPGLLCPAG